MRELEDMECLIIIAIVIAALLFSYNIMALLLGPTDPLAQRIQAVSHATVPMEDRGKVIMEIMRCSATSPVPEHLTERK